MFDKEAIKALQEGEAITAAAAAVEGSLDHLGLVALPKDYDVRDLEKHLMQRRRARGTMTTTSVDPLPTTIYFECAPFAGLQSRTFVMRLGILTGGDKPAITLRIVKPEKHLEEMAEELKGLIDLRFSGAGIPVIVGTYEAK